MSKLQSYANKSKTAQKFLSLFYFFCFMFLLHMCAQFYNVELMSVVSAPSLYSVDSKQKNEDQ